MEAMKSRYIETAGGHEFGGVNSPSQAPYYLKRIEDNLVMPMDDKHVAEYGAGTGDELEGKMKSLRSSSAMTFNLLGNGPVRLNGANGLPAETYTVEYEHQLPTIKGNQNPANLDVKLESVGSETVVYCEMKLAEWVFHGASGLRSPYLDADNYLIPEPQAAAFIEIMESLCADEAGSSDRIKPKLGCYDAFQMMKHLLAIYSEFHRKAAAKEKLPERAMLLNCVWEMAHPEKLGRYEAKYRGREAEEHAQYEQFAKAVAPVVKLFAELGCEFTVRYITFAEMRDALELRSEHRKALERYIV